MLGRSILGLDLGTWSVKACELRQEIRESTLIRFEAQRFPNSASEEERARIVEDFLVESHLPTDFVISALACSHATTRRLHFPFADSKRVLQALPFELEDKVPIPLEQLVRSEECFVTEEGETEVLNILASREEVAQRLQEFRAAHAEPRFLGVEGAVIGNLAKFLRLGESTQCIIDLGHSDTVVTLLRQWRPMFVRSIPVAGRRFTEEIARDLNISFDEAEIHKHEHGIFGTDADPGSESARKAFDLLAREIHRTGEGLRGWLGGAMPSEALLIGGSSKMTGLEEELSRRTGLPCHGLSVAPGERGQSLLASAGAADFAGASALALGGPSSTRSASLNLRSGEFRYRPDLSQLRGQIRNAALLAGLVLILWIGGLVAEAAVYDREKNQLTEQIGRLHTLTFPAIPPGPDPLPTMEAQAREMLELADHLGVTNTGLSSLGVLLEVSTRLPESLDVWLSEMRIERRSLQARGFARDFESVGRVREELLKSGEFSDVRVSDVVTDTKSGGKSFSLTITLGDAR